MTTKSSAPRLNPPALGRLVEHADHGEALGPTRTVLPTGSMPLAANSSWYGRVAEHDDVRRGTAASVPLKKRPARIGTLRAVGEVLARCRSRAIGLVFRSR